MMKVVAWVLLLLLSYFGAAKAGITSTNPWLNAELFINPDYVAEVQSTISAYPVQQTLLQKAAQYPVAYWVDTMAKIPNVTKVLNLAKVQRAARPLNNSIFWCCSLNY